MYYFLISIGVVALSVQAFIGLSFLISCIWENERRASLFAALQFFCMLALLFIYFLLISAGFFRTVIGVCLLIAAYIVSGIAIYNLARKTTPNKMALQGARGYVVGDFDRYDEREQVFARNRSLSAGTSRYRQFYKDHPELEEIDAKRRERGGPLGVLGSIDKPHGSPNVAATLAGLSIPMTLSSAKAVNPRPLSKPQDNPVTISPEEATLRIKGFARNIGADLVGIAKIDPFWMYSRRGEIFHDNWEDWGRELPVDHQYAVILAEEMDFRMVGTAPHTPSVMESMKNYAKGAYLSTQVAAFIANLGYEATTNHLRHYTAILPPLAADAGLGQVGRLGYLMTKELGARLRLSAVTTNLPLVPDQPVDMGIEDFCRLCKKCADCCPSHSIPEDDEPKEHRGALKWKLNAETCFDYWGKIGTDCCVCMRVCPWSHARTFPHRLIVWLITRNKHSRKIFKKMDDIFYGKKPKPKNPPSWASFSL